MHDSIITHKVYTALQLIDTCTGRPLETRQIQILNKEQNISIIVKQQGFCVILSSNIEGLPATIVAEGYEDMPIVLASTEQLYRPHVVHVIPKVSSAGYKPYLTMSSSIEGISHISGLLLTNCTLRFKSYNPKNQNMTIFNQYNKPINQTYHGLLYQDTFLPFTAFQLRGVDEIQTEGLLDHELPPVNTPIAPLIFGMTYPNGKYLFRVLNDTSTAPYLIRYVVNGMSYYQRVDFQSKENIKLEGSTIL